MKLIASKASMPKLPQELRIKMESDFMGFLKEERARYRGGVRKANYDKVQAAAAVAVYMAEKPGKHRQLLEDPFFASMHVRPKGASAVLQFLEKATAENDRERLNREGRAIEEMLMRCIEVNEIAEHLCKRGGVSGVLDAKKKRERLGVANAEAENEDGFQDDEDIAEPADDEVDDDDEADSLVPTVRSTPPKPKHQPPVEGYVVVEVLMLADDAEDVLESKAFRTDVEVNPGPSGWKVITARKTKVLKR